jgi:Tat protein translocase TatC
MPGRRRLLPMARDRKRRGAEHAREMSLGEHLEELRKRVIYGLLGLAAGLLVGFVFGFDLLRLLKDVYLRVVERIGIDADLVILEVSGGLTLYLKVAFYAGIVVSSPWLFVQTWLFVSEGLYRRERRAVLVASAACAVLFLAGIAFFLGLVAENILYYLLLMVRWTGAEPTITFHSHVTFMVRMMFVFGVGFQTPLLIYLLCALGVVSVQRVSHYRRHVIVAILIAAAVLTPPDPFSQLALAVPMWLLFELGVLLAWLSRRRKGRRSDEAAERTGPE